MPRALLLRAVHRNDVVPGNDEAVLLGLRDGLLDDRIRAHKGLCKHWDDAAGDEEVPLRRLAGGDGQDRRPRPIFGQEQRRGACFCQGHDELALRVDGRLHRGGTHRFHRAHAKLFRRAQARGEVEGVVVHDPFRGLADLAHDRDGLDGVAAGGRLAREHHAVRAVEHGVRDVAGLGACGPRGAAHGLEHLRGGDHGLAHEVALRYHHLLRHEDVLGGDFHAQVSAGHHDTVARLANRVEVPHARLVFDLRDDPNTPTPQSEGLPDELHIIRALDEGRGDEVHSMHDAEIHEVVLVLGLEHGEVHLDPGQVAVLPLAQGAVVHDLGDDVVRADGLHLQRQRTVGAKDDVPRLDRLAELLVAQGEARLVTLEAVIRHEFQFLARDEVNLAALLEEAGADLRALGVQKDGHGLATLLASVTDPLHHGAMRLVVAVREIEARDVHARLYELHQRLHRGLVRAHGANDLALPRHALGCFLEFAILGHVQVRRDLCLSEARHGCNVHRLSSGEFDPLPLILTSPIVWCARA
mmetsp:Transcript_2926/g.7478  ORF Transcript_2926/g.7478 Transcript_2926/m.7478 type:complete len:526 (-) Transcript_2926:23-1600(-)